MQSRCPWLHTDRGRSLRTADRCFSRLTMPHDDRLAEPHAVRLEATAKARTLIACGPGARPRRRPIADTTLAKWWLKHRPHSRGAHAEELRGQAVVVAQTYIRITG